MCREIEHFLAILANRFHLQRLITFSLASYSPRKKSTRNSRNLQRCTVKFSTYVAQCKTWTRCSIVWLISHFLQLIAQHKLMQINHSGFGRKIGHGVLARNKPLSTAKHQLDDQRKDWDFLFPLHDDVASAADSINSWVVFRASGAHTHNEKMNFQPNMMQ